MKSSHTPLKKNLKTLFDNKETYLGYENEEVITWCNGCGNYQIQNALKRALTLEGIKPHNILYCFDIGCNGNGSDKIGGYTLHSLHGRVISSAAGACLANPALTVIASGGDGGTMSEGINHLIHAVRSDYPMVFILHNNHNYGLTTGQASATTPKGFPMNGSPDGVFIEPMNPSEFVLNLNPSFVARSFSGDVKHMTYVLREALNHNGFAFVEILQVCPTYNKATPQQWYWDRIKYTDDMKNYRADNLKKAKKIVEDFEKNIYLGVLYQDKKRKNFLERLPNRKGIKTTPVEEVKHYSITSLLKEFE
ncbi:2-oxoacid:ferredoxin oxidoreductase subunit beta [Candidatus Peregrinibacteria bacterium]|nr:2-oxoacid:ferredoxin oxidoreductase subunit beta [Candidatus Peregrinibacteria bacterium]